MAKKTTEHSALFEKYKERYEKGYCTKEQLKKIVALGRLTADEYKEITGEDYEE